MPPPAARSAARLAEHPAGCLLVALLSVPGSPRGQEGRLARELRFVHRLATELQLVSLAQLEVERLQQAYQAGPEQQQIAALGVEIAWLRARLHPIREEKRALYQGALARCRDLAAQAGAGPAAAQAQRTIADVALELGRFLADELEVARLEAAAAVPDLEAAAAQVLREGDTACAAAMRALEGARANAESRADYYLAWMRQGILQRELARAVPQDRARLAALARRTLEALVLEVGEETALGQRALFESARIAEIEGRLDQAQSSYREVIGNADAALTSASLALPADVKALVRATLEEAYERLARVLLQAADFAGVVKVSGEYRDHLRRLGTAVLDLDAPSQGAGGEDREHGASLYVSHARALAETGGEASVRAALALLRHLSAQHPSDSVGLRAKLALKDILARHDRHLSGALLLEVAKGDYQRRDWTAASATLQRAIARMREDELARLGFEAQQMLAQSLALQGRALEATQALALGLEQHAADTSAAVRASAAELMQRTLRQARAAGGDDPALAELSRRVLDLAARHGAIADLGLSLWQEGNAALADKRYAAALAAYERIPGSSPYFEWALARKAVTLERQGDAEGARVAIGAYRAWVEGPTARLPEGRADLAEVRRGAQAEVDFSEASLAFKAATTEAPGRKRDPTRFPEVLTLLADFEARHGKAAPHLVPNVHYMLGRSLLETGSLEAAEARQHTLAALADPGAKRFASALAAAIFTAWDGQVTAKRLEVAALERTAEVPGLAAATQELQDLQRRAAAAGIGYFQGAEAPQYAIAFLTLQHLHGLAEPERVAAFGQEVVDRFGADPATREKVDKFVRPILGEAMLRQHKFRQAYDLLVAAGQSKPGDGPLARLISLALGGWQEVDALGRIQRYEGLGRPAEAYDKYWGEYRPYAMARGADRYSLAWYELHWEAYHFALGAARSDSLYAGRARALFRLAEAGDGFARLASLGPAGRTLADLFLDAANQPP